MVLPSLRLLNLMAAAGGIFLILFAILYLQQVLGLPPCPLCIFQRIAFMAVVLVSLVAALHGPRLLGVRVYGLLGLVVSLAGAGIAGRHLWLQWQPDNQVVSCGPGLSFMMDHYPMSDLLSAVFRGSGDCGAQHWQWLGLSIPGWSLFFFVIFILFFGLQLLRGDFTRRAHRSGW